MLTRLVSRREMIRAASPSELPGGESGSSPSPATVPGTQAPAGTTLLPRRRRSTIYAVAAIVVVVVIVGAAYALTGGFYRSPGGSQVEVLIPYSSVYYVKVGQYVSLSFEASSRGTLNASFNTGVGILFYVMTPAEFQSTLNTDNASAYAWASGFQQMGYLNTAVAAGQWDFVMGDPNATTATGVGFDTPLTLTLS